MIELLWVNKDIQTLYFSDGPLFCKSVDEFNKMVLQEKKKIAERAYVLNRFEPWEVTNNNSLKMLLISRAKNTNERNLVLKYMKHLQNQ